MTLTEYNERLTEAVGLVSGNIVEDTLLPAALQMLHSIKDRISNEGKKTDGSSIGNYSTKPVYVAKEMFAKPGAFVPRGKGFDKYNNTPGDRIIPGVRLKTDHIKREPVSYKRYAVVKPDLKPRKTMYMPDGYKELRDTQSLRTDIVNFKYRGDLLNSYVVDTDGQSVIMGLTSELSAKKREGLEGKFGKTLSPSQPELEQCKGKISFLLNRITKGILIEGHSVTATIE